MSNKSFQSSPPSSEVQLFYSSSLSPPPTPAKGSRGIIDRTKLLVPIFFPRSMRETTTHHMQIKKKENVRQQSNSLLRSKSVPCMQIKPRHVHMTAGTASTTHSRSSIKIENILPPPFSLPSESSWRESSTSSGTGGIINNMPACPSLLATKSESFKLPKRSSMHFKPKRRASLTSRAA